MQLKVKTKSDRTGQFEFRPGVPFTLRYVSERRMMQFDDKSKKSFWKDHQLVKERDDEKFYQFCADEMIAGWDGFTGRLLTELVDLEENPYDDDEEVPYSPELAYLLMRHCTEFDIWATRHCKALEEFVALEEAARKNASSPTRGNSTHGAAPTSIATDAADLPNNSPRSATDTPA